MDRALPKKDAANTHSPRHSTNEDEISHGETPNHQKKPDHEEGQEDSAEELAEE